MITKLTIQSFFLTLALVVFLLLDARTSFAQCINDNTFYLDVSTSGDGTTATANCVYGGEYLTASVCDGVTYYISMCNAAWDTQITLYDGANAYLDYDDDGCGDIYGPSNLTWTATYTGTLYIVVDEWNCISNSTCGTLTVTQVGVCNEACANNNTLYNVNATPSGAGSTINVNVMYGGEYVNVNVCNGANYTFSTCSATYDTQLSLYTPSGTLLAYDDDGCGTFAGPSIINWTSNMTGTVRVLLDQYPCVANTTSTTLSITQNTACPSSCSFSLVLGEYNSCSGTQELVDFYAYYSGACTVEGIYLYSAALGLEYVDLSLYGYTSGDAIGILLGLDNTTYTYYFVLSNGTESLDYFYTTGQCPAATCAFTGMSILPNGCDGTDENVIFYPTYTGSCFIEGMWLYTISGGTEYIDLSLYGFTSGDAISILLPQDNTEYEYSFVLDNNVESLTYPYTTGTCDIGGCIISSVFTNPIGCVGTDESIDFYVYYSGACSVYSMWVYTAALGWEEVLLSGFDTSGDPINISFTFDDTEYLYYFELSDGTLSDTYSYTTGNCDNQSTCTNLFIDYNNTGCMNVGAGYSPSGDILAFYDGACTIEGVYTSVNGAAFEYLDLSAYGFTSGDPVGLYFNVQNADYEVFYVLSDGSPSPSTFFTTETCESGETICDCAGTQLPIESLAWLGDGSLDDGSFNWNNDLSLPVNFNCATWGFDCGDQLPDGYFSYDPYGVCSGEMPPSNGCVDEFCYNIDLDVITDCHPEDIQVYIYNSNGDQVFTAGYVDFITQSDFTYTFAMCLPADCYTYVITDVFGDGLAGLDCGGIGYSGIYDYATGTYVVLANGDAYLDIYSGEFCVGPQTICSNLDMILTEEDCYPNGNVLLPSISYVFDFNGPCTVQSLFYSLNGGAFTELDVSANGWGSGDEGFLYYLQANSDYTIYYTTDDGASSFLYDFSTGNCLNEITICDCNGTQLSIGVTSWLGDGFADNGFYQWAGQDVNFNCSTWGYDCGDIDGAPSFDPYNVCSGELPPFNGCIENQDVLGCMDPTAINYNPTATINDGSCIYDIQIGCMDDGACNYNELAVIDDGSCNYTSCAGCMDPDATNYDPTATIDDASCIYIEFSGCTDDMALNFDPIATIDDGSCIYTCLWPTVDYDAHCVSGDLLNFYIDVDLNALGNGAPYTITNSNNNQQQVMNLIGSVTMGPFPTGTLVVVQVTSNTIDCLLTSQPLTQDCSVAGIYGCTDPVALNYNPDATINDGSCEYAQILGCMDPTALNYNPAATIDDGSCIYTGVDEMDIQHFTMYPNPAKDLVVLTNNGNSPVVNIRILDSTGRLISNEQVVISPGTSHMLNVASLSQGNYIIEILTEGNIEHHRVIIQK